MYSSLDLKFLRTTLFKNYTKQLTSHLHAKKVKNLDLKV